MIDPPSRMLLSGRLAESLRDRLVDAVPELETRVVHGRTLSADDLAWADSWSGLAVPVNVAESGMRWMHLQVAGLDRALPLLREMPSPPMLTRTLGAMPQKIGAYVLAHLLAESQRLEEFRVRQARHAWEPIEPVSHVGQTAVVLGTGRIGSGVASALRSVGFRVVGVSRGGVAREPFDAVVTRAAALAEYARCSVLVCALPLTEETRHAVGAHLFGAMNGAVFVNVGRGESVDESALRAALDDGHVSRAVLDVFGTEPLPGDSWMWEHPGVTVTPHIAGVTDIDDVVNALLSAYAAIRAGALPEGLVDVSRGY